MDNPVHILLTKFVFCDSDGTEKSTTWGYTLDNDFESLFVMNTNPWTKRQTQFLRKTFYALSRSAILISWPASIAKADSYWKTYGSI
jgi:hypothetical protein